MDTEAKKTELAELKQRVADLESQIAIETEYTPFRPQGYYTAYFATTGFMLGILEQPQAYCLMWSDQSSRVAILWRLFARI